MPSLKHLSVHGSSDRESAKEKEKAAPGEAARRRPGRKPRPIAGCSQNNEMATLIRFECPVWTSKTNKRPTAHVASGIARKGVEACHTMGRLPPSMCCLVESEGDVNDGTGFYRVPRMKKFLKGRIWPRLKKTTAEASDRIRLVYPGEGNNSSVDSNLR